MKHVVKIILLILNTLWGLLLIMGAYSAYCPTRVGILLELLFPLNLFVCVAFLFVWLAYNPRYIWVPVAALVLAWGGIARYCPIHKPQPPDNSAPGFTLMTYNVYFLLDYEGSDTPQNRTISFLLAQDADLVCLQEAPELADPNPGLKVAQAQIDSIHARYPYRIPTSHGMNFLSKYPARLLFDTVYSESSAVAAYRVQIGEREVTVVNQHMESIGLTQTDKELYHEITAHPNTDYLDEVKKHLLSKLVNAARARNKQADLTAEKIEELVGNVIVCGDFNDSPLSYAVRRFRRMGFRNAYNELGLGPGITYHANRFWFRIDHILYKGNMEARWLERLRYKSSDHYPLLVRFAWEPPAEIH